MSKQPPVGLEEGRVVREGGCLAPQDVHKGKVSVGLKISSELNNSMIP